jgi:hypothetical protein
VFDRGQTGSGTYLCLVILLSALAARAAADDKPYAITAYGGWAMDNKFGQMPWPGNWQRYEEDASLAGVGVSRQVGQVLHGKIGLEIEGQVMRHWGKQNLWESVVAGLARWKDLPWDKTIDSSIAVGTGLSHFSKISTIEQIRNSEQARTLGYVALEVTAAPPQTRQWEGVFRIHHRSGGFGLVNGVKGGSNYLVLGIRKQFGRE